MVAFREDLRRALFLVPWPLVFIVYMGTQERFFGRWLLPALPALAILAGLAATRLLDLVADRRPRVLAVAGVAVAAALAAQGLYYSVHVDRVLSQRRHAQPRARMDGGQHPRRRRRSWSSRSCPTPGSPTPTPRTRRRRAGAG